MIQIKLHFTNPCTNPMGPHTPIIVACVCLIWPDLSCIHTSTSSFVRTLFICYVN